MAIPLLAALTVAQGVGKILGAFSAGRATRANYRLAKREAADVLARGEEEVSRYEMDFSRLLGAQRTILGAGQGLDVNQGSALQLRKQSERFAAEDVETIRLNATRAAWGIMANARVDRRAGRAQAAVGFLEGAATLTPTLVGGGAKAWDWYRKRKVVPSIVPTGSTSGLNFDFRG